MPERWSGSWPDCLRLALTALFQQQTGTQFVLVPYRGAAPEMQDLVAGRIDLSFQPSDELSMARAGIVKALASTSDVRLAVAPDIPTFREMGLPELSFSNWFGLFAPRGTPVDIIGSLNAAAVEVFAEAAVRSRLVELGMNIFPREQQTAAALGTLVESDAEKWWPIIEKSGIRGK